MKNSKKLGTESIGRLLFSLAIPSIVGTFVNALYNLVDRLYIGRWCGTDVMAGLSLTFPYMMILASFGMLMGIGSGAVISIRLGEGKHDEAEKTLGQFVAVILLFFLTLPVLAWFTLDYTLLKFGGTVSTIPPAVEYLKVILFGNIFAHLSFGMSALMRAQGHSAKGMTCMIIGAVSNVILDPIFIFVFDMGIAGAAWATNIAMFLSFLYALRYFTSKECIVPLRLRQIGIHWSRFRPVLAIGLSPFMMNIVASGIMICFNRVFGQYSQSIAENDRVIACSGIINGILLFILQPVFGLSQGMQPITGYNYGAKQYQRVGEAFKQGMIYATLLCSISTVLCCIFARQLVACFTTDPELIKLGTWTLRVSCSVFPLIGAPIISTTYFQSVNRPRTSIVLSLLRQVIVLLPLIYIIPYFYGINGVWFAGPISDIISSIITMAVVAYEFKHLNNLIESNGLKV